MSFNEFEEEESYENQLIVNVKELMKDKKTVSNNQVSQLISLIEEQENEISNLYNGMENLSKQVTTYCEESDYWRKKYEELIK
ncbi:hypothetical protein [Priestia aryabhattai]|uniref:hypothetical protein n=1 Tax=Priestia aryabhattai TaxID=412384 RepID=UPI0015F6C99C|nr:hypothetical protein [Priestia aryabhattai]